MPRPYRKERLDELLKRELESIICYELSDPRLDHITVSEVDVSKDGRPRECARFHPQPDRR